MVNKSNEENSSVTILELFDCLFTHPAVFSIELIIITVKTNKNESD